MATDEIDSEIPLLIPELLSHVLNFVDDPPDILSCACVNRLWNTTALQKLYEGSMSDMRYRTPPIGFLDSLLTASRDRFAQQMSFVKHLTILPELAATDGYQDVHRPLCHDRWRLLRKECDTKLLINQEGKSYESLAIPLDLVNQEYQLRLPLLFHPDLKFLSIDIMYCGILAHWLASTPYLNTKLGPLALTVFRSQCHGIHRLVECLKKIELKVFNLQDPFEDIQDISRHDLHNLIQALIAHPHLQAFSFMTKCCSPRTGEIVMQITKGLKSKIWPSLQAVSLRYIDDPWFKILPRLDCLVLLDLREIVQRGQYYNLQAAEAISKCRKLRSLVVEFDALTDSNIMMLIAHGCPLLQRLHVKVHNEGLSKELGDDHMIQLFQSLRRLEVLCINMIVHMTSRSIQQLARLCPELRALLLDRAYLVISYEPLSKTKSFRNLEILDLRQIAFITPQYFELEDEVNRFAIIWKRVFPRMTIIPSRGNTNKVCFADLKDEDLPGPDINGDIHMQSRVDGVAAGDHGGVQDVPESAQTLIATNGHSPSNKDDHEHGMLRLIEFRSPFDVPIQNSRFSFFAHRVWLSLNYLQASFAFEKFDNIWQSDLEIEVLGSPLLSIDAYIRPARHSTGTKEKH